MKYLYTVLFSLLSIFLLNAQQPVIVSYGTSYSMHDFYRLSDDSILNVANSDWDIAFLNARGSQGQLAGIHINEATASMGSEVALYLSPSSNFSDPVSVDDLVIRLYNSDSTWQTGGFNAFRDPLNPDDWGWGAYDATENAILGYDVFVVKLRNESYKKFEIRELRGTVYQIRWADLDGSNEVNYTLDLADYPDAELILFSLQNESIYAAAEGYDLVFTRYVHPLDDGNGGFLDYVVTGVLSGNDVQVAKVVGQDPETVAFEDYRDSLNSRTDIIGFDWKEFSLGTFSWVIFDDWVYFIKDRDDKVWKVRFIDFEGSSTGNTVFTKEDLGVLNSVNNIAGLQGFMITPNPAEGECHLIAEMDRDVDLELMIFDLQGKLVKSGNIRLPKGFNSLPVDLQGLNSGQYIVTLSDGLSASSTRLIIR